MMMIMMMMVMMVIMIEILVMIKIMMKSQISIPRHRHAMDIIKSALPRSIFEESVSSFVGPSSEFNASLR